MERFIEDCHFFAGMDGVRCCKGVVYDGHGSSGKEAS
jgi:hypothetical protein